ncbi:glycolipid transfer protein 3-like isoform X2 [Euphorbia lathyris]|uniref:glycolipid transfer protein 3-like isoform X2 n=1 Tax=Euphorbia lathyris TaxID=212925 RepID=UPI0033130FF8
MVTDLFPGLSVLMISTFVSVYTSSAQRTSESEKGVRLEMKRTREIDRSSEIKSAIEEVSLMIQLKKNCVDEAHYIPTRQFLYICNLVIQVLDKIGPTMTVLRQDINQNVERLQKQCDSDPLMYSNIVEIVKKEVDQGIERKGNSSSKALVWLTRSLDFTVALLERLVKDPDRKMEQIVEDSYNISLKSWHGWISSAAFRVGLKLIPDRKTFVTLLKPKDEENDKFIADMGTLVELLLPLLQEIHSILTLYRLDRLKAI